MDREYIQPGFKDILDFKLSGCTFREESTPFFYGGFDPGWLFRV